MTVTLSAALHQISSSADKDSLAKPTTTQRLRAEVRRSEHNQHFYCHCESKTVADADTQHPTNRPWPWETAGVKGQPDDNFEPQAKENKLSVAANLI